MPNSLSENGIKLISLFEGLKTKAYRCSAKVLTIGIGETGTFALTGEKIYPEMEITEQQAKDSFRIAVKKYEKAVNDNVTVELNQNQFDALVSFVYNVGETNFKNSTLLKLLNKGLYKEASAQFEKWVYANGVKLQGLLNRRMLEKEIFLLNI